jgi:hypothetical protein
MAGPPTGTACQRQHWTSHKRQCRTLAQDEFVSIIQRRGVVGMESIFTNPAPSDLPLLLKISATTWTTRPEFSEMHAHSLVSRAILLERGRPAPGDTKETLVRLIKRAAIELPWPELPGGAQDIFEGPFVSLDIIAKFGEPEAAVEILSQHVEDVERRLVARNHVAKWYIYRLDWLLSAAVKLAEDEEKRGAYVAEAKGLMERAARSLTGMPPRDVSALVSPLTSAWTLDRLSVILR